ncbi:MAG TPA: CsgG/HfaB family protein [Thermoanaerobaculia bacterium]|nr:CsgG/HfaB family protein [Thermoanaerobaculia bacterium]HUM29463.1 CsgG/HfaB family protein [Thermoanaerobaculia bacterium]HXK67846.1 CsgG/HfaB family protein [Thermoanaerobaculia bacterium]
MRKFVLFAMMALMMIFAVAALAGEKPSIGVLRFTNHAHCYWWGSGVGDELSDMLASELASKKVFSVLERKEISAVLGEQDLGASGRIDPSTRAKIGKIKGAQYLVAASVSAYEENTKGGGGGISFGGISVGGKKDKAYIAVDLKIIDTTTGEIVDTRTVEATSKSGGLNLGLYKWGVGSHLEQHSKTPVGKAIRACVIEIADYLECSMIKGKDSSCMKEYDAKEQKRREKTKSAIDLE